MTLFSLAERLTQRALNARGIRSRWVDTSVARLHLYDAPGHGSLPPVVVLHGISSSAAAYGPLIQRLRAHFRRVIAPEAPGHGLSDLPRQPLTPDTLFASLSELLDQQLDEPAIVFGCSLGGAVAVSYALARPDRVQGLMLASPAGATMDAAELEQFLKTFRLQSRTDANNFMARLYHRPPWYTSLLAPALIHLFSRPVITSFTSSVRPEHLFTSEQLASLSMPVHLLWGRGDRLMPESSFAFYRRSLPAQAVIEQPEQMGHCPHLDDPSALAGMIAGFAQRVERERKAAADNHTAVAGQAEILAAPEQ